MAQSSSLRDVLEQHAIRELLNDTQAHPVTCFLDNDSIGYVLECMAKEGIVTAPLLDHTKVNGTTSDRSYSQVEVDSIMAFVDLNVILQAFLRDAFESSILHFTVMEIDRIGAKFCARLVGELLQDDHPSVHGAHASDWALKGRACSSLLTIIRECFLFTKPGSMKPPRLPARSIHQCAIFHPGGDSPCRLTGLVTQSDIIRFLHDHASNTGVMQKAVRSLGLVGFTSAEVPPSPSSTSSDNSERLSKPSSRPHNALIPPNITALEAFRQMCMQRTSSVGLVGPEGTLVSTLSALDLKCLAPGNFDSLLLPVDEFLAEQPLLGKHQPSPTVSQEDGEERPPKRRRSCHKPTRILTCQATSTLAEVIAILACHDAHSVYVVDPDTRPLCSITVTDVLRVVVHSVVALTVIAPAKPLRDPPPPPESVTSGASERAASLTTSLQSEAC